MWVSFDAKGAGYVPPVVIFVVVKVTQYNVMPWPLSPVLWRPTVEKLFDFFVFNFLAILL